MKDVRPFCPRYGSKTILQPRNNLLCGIRILDNQIVAHRRPLFTRKSYWSTLQPGTVGFEVFRKQMASVPEVCRETPSMDEARSRSGIPLSEVQSMQVKATEGH